MTTKDLIPLTKGSQRAKDLGRKGGQSKSPRKQAAARMNGLLGNKKMSRQTAEFYFMVKDGKIANVIYDLVTQNYDEGRKDPERRDKIIQQLQTMLPKVNINYEITDNDVVKTCFEVLTELKHDNAIKIISERLKNLEEGQLK